ncbi:mandelate racemase/muconate lactonizing enzyme family protein [Candidatus Gracilibacteria bacterium]|nr:mandelate racemase/muconate lactonizing enzyme family protein [Candidatus Gracilibacteria bacterium]
MATSLPSRIAQVEAFVLVGDKDYVGEAGLGTTHSGATPASSGRALATLGDLHICSYPPQAQTCLVKITDSLGTVGWGEAHAPLGPRATCAVITDVLRPLLLDADPLAIEQHWERMYGSMRLRGHVAGYQLEAIAGVDIALWDLAGKLLNQPIYRLLGGPFRRQLPAYASGIPGTTIAERVGTARRFLNEGYTAMKLSVGRGDVDSDLATVAAVAEAVRGHADLLVDAHGAYTADTALYAGRAMERMGVYWLEDPLPPEDVDGYVRLSAALDMAVAAGETECTRWQFAERLARRSVDIILPDICRAGGISEGRRIATVASLHNTRWAAHVSMGSSVHIAAAAHLAAASANFLVFEFSSTPNPIGDRLLTTTLRPSDGLITVPAGPGLGIVFDQARLQEHLVTP